MDVPFGYAEIQVTIKMRRGRMHLQARFKPRSVYASFIVLLVRRVFLVVDPKNFDVFVVRLSVAPNFW